jgi:hypothetical protein
MPTICANPGALRQTTPTPGQVDEAKKRAPTMLQHDPMARCCLLVLVVAIPLLLPSGALAQGTTGVNRVDGGRHTPFHNDYRTISENSRTVTGLLQQIDAAGVITLIDERGQSLRLYQASNAVITMDGRIVSLTDVPVGVLAVVTFQPGTSTLPAFFTIVNNLKEVKG